MSPTSPFLPNPSSLVVSEGRSDASDAAVYHGAVNGLQLKSQRLTPRERLQYGAYTLLPQGEAAHLIGSHRDKKNDGPASNGYEPEQIHCPHLSFDNRSGGGPQHSGSSAIDSGALGAGVSEPVDASAANAEVVASLTAAQIASEALAVTNFEGELRTDWHLSALAADCIAQIIDWYDGYPEWEAIPAATRRQAEELLYAHGDMLLQQCEDELRDAIESGELDEDGSLMPFDPYPYDRYPFGKNL